MFKSINKVENNVSKYNDLEYLSSKIRFVDYISDKNNVVHDKLYMSALNRYLEEKLHTTYDEYSKTHILMEIKNKEYWMPSKVFIKDISVMPYNISKVDLSPYWDNYQYVSEYKNFDNMFFENVEDINGSEVVEINYVLGQAKFRNKYSGEEFWKDFKFLNKDTVYNKDETSLEDTFSYKLQHKIYGR